MIQAMRCPQEGRPNAWTISTSPPAIIRNPTMSTVMLPATKGIAIARIPARMRRMPPAVRMSASQVSNGMAASERRRAGSRWIQR